MGGTMGKDGAPHHSGQSDVQQANGAAAINADNDKGSSTTLSSPSNYCGLVNFGNTCYCNSVLQALYFCRPFRNTILNYRPPPLPAKSPNPAGASLLACLNELYQQLSSRRRRGSAVAPKKFIQRLKKENEQFDNFLQHDAHEFFIYLLNRIVDIVNEEKRLASGDTSIHTNISLSTANTWVHDLFQGFLTNETRCLNCDTVSAKDEAFLDLSVDIEHNTSLSHCLVHSFSGLEMLCGDHKYHCEVCLSKQEAQKCMRVKRLPKILVLHLKRFKYVEQLQRHAKLSCRVLFPLELRLFNTSSDATDADRLYELVSVVVHCGVGPNRGHYVTVVRTEPGPCSSWLLFDDDVVEKLDLSQFEEFYGLADKQTSSTPGGPGTQSGLSDHVASLQSQQRSSDSGYILFYEAIEH